MIDKPIKMSAAAQALKKKARGKTNKRNSLVLIRFSASRRQIMDTQGSKIIQFLTITYTITLKDRY